MLSKIHVFVNEKTIAWKTLKIHKNLDEICHTLELEIPVQERSKIAKHDTIVVRVVNPLFKGIDNNRLPVVKVKVDKIDEHREESSSSISVFGRSPARDIIDSTYSGSISGNADLLQVTKEIAEPFGIEVLHMPTNRNGTKPIESFSWENESPWEKLLTHADAQGYIITSNQIGNLYLWTPASGVRGEGFELREGKQINNITGSENGGGQFRFYRFCSNYNTVTVEDTTCPGQRIFTKNITDLQFDEEKLTRLATTEMLRRKENTINVTVSGWGLSDAQLKALGTVVQKEAFWSPNFLIPVIIPSSGIDTNMLIESVDHVADNQSWSTSINLVKPEAFR